MMKFFKLLKSKIRQIQKQEDEYYAKRLKEYEIAEALKTSWENSVTRWNILLDKSADCPCDVHSSAAKRAFSMALHAKTAYQRYVRDHNL